MAYGSSQSLYYYYRQLSGTERRVYDELLEGLQAMSSEIVLSCGDFDTIERVVDLVMADHPELFWFPGGGRMRQYGDQFSFQPKYTMSRMTKASRERSINRVTEGFLRDIRFCRTDVERLEAAYLYLVKNVTYEENSADSQNICSALINHRSVCAGYSKALQVLLQKMGIECLYISGTLTGRRSHAWNMVKLDGKYYHTDVTHGDRSFFDGTSVGNGLPVELEAECGYLCMSDEEALRDRTIKTISGVRIPVCNSTRMNWYPRHNLYFSQKEEAWSAIEKSLARNQKYFCCQFSSKLAYDAFLRDLSKGKFADLALEKMNLRRVSTRSSHCDSLRIVIGWAQ